ncbi:MAG: amino acid ABC transporter permease, partial [Candidatus Electrothrix sp. ATG1]|nr:amino acid ABC transporter permease [Candidatus Electrothrix sp. ATG1]
MTTAHTTHPDLPPPLTSVGVVGWLRKNLFSTPLNTLFTLGAFYLLYRFIPPMINWALLDADWTGTGPEACSGDGACWVFVRLRLLHFMVGFYPEGELWRPVAAFGLGTLLLLYLLIKNLPYKGCVAGFTILGFPFLAFFIFYGGLFGLPVVETHQWGGLMLTLILSTVGMHQAAPLMGLN